MNRIAPAPVSGVGHGAKRRNYYKEFVEGSRWLRREQSLARTTWFETLPLPGKARLLFEFEMMLKGLVCFGNPVNHTGPHKKAEPAGSRDYKSELSIVRHLIKHIIEVGHQLSGPRERSVVYRRYLESVIAQDEARFQLVKQSLHQDTPEQGLSLLLAAFQNILDVVDGLESASYVSYRLFTSVIRLVEREVHGSTYFNPLAALEFRQEFDQISPDEILTLVIGIKSEPARKIAALSFLSLHRLMSYIDAIEAELKRGDNLSLLCGWLAVLRSDVRALTIFFRRDTATWIASGFGRLYEDLGPQDINLRYDGFEREFKTLKSLRELLISVGDQLRLEQRKVFEHHLPSLAEVESLENFANMVAATTGPMRAFLQNAVILLALEFDPNLNGARVFAGFVPKMVQSERLRRDIWMFQQILRAFIEKAKSSAPATDTWSGMNSFRFVRQFVSYFRSMGYQLLRYSDYEKFDNFMTLVDRLREGDVLEVQRVERVIEVCQDFQQFLGKTFESVGNRQELRGMPFDRKEAAKTLKLFLRR